jgi:DedD protein
MMERRVKERLIGATLLVALIVLIVPEMLSGPRQPSAPPLTQGLPSPTRSVSVDLATSKATADPGLPEGAASAAPAPPTASAASTAAPDESVVSGAPGGAAAGSAASGGAAPGTAASGDDTSPEAARPGHAMPESPPTVTTLRAQPSAEPPVESPLPSPQSTAGVSRSEARGDTAPAPPGRRGWAVQIGSFASRANAARLIRQLQSRAAAPLYVSASGAGPSLRYRVRLGPLADRGSAERAAGKLKAAGHPATVVAPAS